MRLKSVKILTSFRGLKAGSTYRFDNVDLLENQIEPLCFVGVNGSGKSNLLEVIAVIFFYLDTFKTELENSAKKNFKTSFGFEISYDIDIKTEISSRGGLKNIQGLLDTESGDIEVSIKKKPNELPEISIDSNSSSLIENSSDPEDFVLPVHVISYSSGENELISNPFIKSSYRYFDELTSKKSEDINEELPLSRLFHLDYVNAQLVTLCNFLFSDDNDVNLIRKAIKVKELDSFNIIIRYRDYKNDKLDFAQLIKQTISDLKECASASEEIEGKANFRELKLSFILDREGHMKRAFKRKFGSALRLYKGLYYLNLMNIHLHSISIRKHIRNIGSFDDNLSRLVPKPSVDQLVFQVEKLKFRKPKSEKLIKYKQLSDGEHQLMQSLGSIMLLNLSGSILLFDEPETHFNPDWRSRFISLINKAAKEKERTKLREQEIIITSHSPFIVSDCRKERVFIFKNGRAENPDIKTFGTSVNILTEEVFGKKDSISELSLNEIDNIRNSDLSTLDKIQEAKEASRKLGESVEKVLLFRELILKENELKNT